MLKSSAAERNKEPILKVLQQIIPHEPAHALEIASGTGQHVLYFANNLQHITWQPTECDQDSLRSIQLYKDQSASANIRDGQYLRTTSPVDQWLNGSMKPASCDLIFCVNLVHYTEWASTQGLFEGSKTYLKPGGVLVIYGPFKLHGEITPISNVQFDKMLKQQNNEWGLRDVDDLEKLGEDVALKLEKIFDMPANNKTLVFRKTY